MKILIGCEESGIVRDAFLLKGHDVISCDILQTSRPGPHYQGDIMDLLSSDWDMVIAFPPCTHLSVSGARWWRDKQADGRQGKAVDFFMGLVDCAGKVAIENPVGIMSTKYRKPDQIIQPWQYGHGETKATCIWLKNLPLLKPTNIVDGRAPRIHYMAPGPLRSKLRSRAYDGIAAAMADQWG